MKMTLTEARKHLADLLGLGDVKLPVKLNYAVSYNIEKLEQEMKRAEKNRVELCKEYSEKDEKGEPVMIKKENGESFDISEENMRKLNADLQELYDTEAEIEIRTVKEELLEPCDNNERYNALEVGHMNALFFMIEE